MENPGQQIDRPQRARLERSSPLDYGPEIDKKNRIGSRARE